MIWKFVQGKKRFLFIFLCHISLVTADAGIFWNRLKVKLKAISLQHLQDFQNDVSQHFKNQTRLIIIAAGKDHNKDGLYSRNILNGSFLIRSESVVL